MMVVLYGCMMVRAAFASVCVQFLCVYCVQFLCECMCVFVGGLSVSV